MFYVQNHAVTPFADSMVGALEILAYSLRSSRESAKPLGAFTITIREEVKVKVIACFRQSYVILQLDFCSCGSKSKSLGFEIVISMDETDGARFHPHQDRMRDGCRTVDLDPLQ